jgi:hypothetical protein
MPRGPPLSPIQNTVRENSRLRLLGQDDHLTSVRLKDTRPRRDRAGEDAAGDPAIPHERTRTLLSVGAPHLLDLA